jgi:hypothetical protein
MLPLPPGPKKMPLVGNLFDMPATDHWEIYQKWSRDFGSFILTCLHRCYHLIRF